MARIALLLLALALPGLVLAGDDDYASMLGYLNSGSRIDGQAFRGSSGALAVNIAAGDMNLQSNLRAVASGQYAQALYAARQRRSGDLHPADLAASATIGGQAYAGGRGVLSINQASGSGNAEINAIALAAADQGIREATDASLADDVSASAGGQASRNPRPSVGGSRNAAVESSALRGFQGVLQLNQVAGSDNVTGNALQLSVPAPSH
ncbi:hypothetical protein [Fulvimonas soli]|uniref:Fap amyloid fibril minor component n=1 Tax=Fulvimonas soli TaxID=155197 RepID=A0A316HZ69_9GAMM|nr:hypothetical protein [Fulvimonas soli]PWK86617.1 hypothetical protein C7456_1077 [Fulvimonas soli]TNY25546.1 hypothetical protein BV497_13340 [Fulvimonas soli]